jgi:hypothetical protein
MDSFVRRLKYYGIGFGMGLIFVIFFFQNRGCSWTPTNRIKSSILERVIVIPVTEKGLFSNDKKLEKELVNYLENGEIDFGNSRKQEPNKFYKVDLEGYKSLYFTLPKDSFISAVYRSKPKNNTWKGQARMFLFPDVKDLIFMDTTDLVSCQLLGLGFKDERHLQEQLMKNATIDFGKSVVEDVVKPEHFIEFLSPKGNKIGITAVWYKSKINVISFSVADSLSCE